MRYIGKARCLSGLVMFSDPANWIGNNGYPRDSWNGFIRKIEKAGIENKQGIQLDYPKGDDFGRAVVLDVGKKGKSYPVFATYTRDGRLKQITIKTEED